MKGLGLLLSGRLLQFGVFRDILFKCLYSPGYYPQVSSYRRGFTCCVVNLIYSYYFIYQRNTNSSQIWEYKLPLRSYRSTNKTANGLSASGGSPGTLKLVHLTLNSCLSSTNLSSSQFSKSYILKSSLIFLFTHHPQIFFTKSCSFKLFFILFSSLHFLCPSFLVQFYSYSFLSPYLILHPQDFSKAILYNAPILIL